MKSHFYFAAAFALSLPMAAIAQQPAALVTAGSADAGAKSASMCIGCHSIPGYQASFPRVYRVPKIGGQDAVYIEAALHEYQRGERNHPTMLAIARGLSDQQISDLAAYYAARGK